MLSTWARMRRNALLCPQLTELFRSGHADFLQIFRQLPVNVGQAGQFLYRIPLGAASASGPQKPGRSYR